MGNWSCLYHWFEFKEKLDADKAFKALEISYEEYDWIDKSKIALKFGYLSDKLIQVVTSQKWGLNDDFTHYIYDNNKMGCAICAGVDSHESFQIIGKPVFFNLSWNYIFVSSKKVDILDISQINDFKDVVVIRKYNRTVLNFNRSYCFSKEWARNNFPFYKVGLIT